MKILLVAKRGHFPRAGLNFKIPTEALLRLYFYTSVHDSVVHLRLRENLYSLFAGSCCLNPNSDNWLVLFMQQRPAASPAASDISLIGALILLRWRIGRRRLKKDREEKNEEFLLDTARMLNCLFEAQPAHCTHQSMEQWSQIKPISGALSKFLGFRKSHTGKKTM